VLDTERADKQQTASELYADRFTFDVIDWTPPYDPRELTVTLQDMSRTAGPDDVIVVDSLSAFWTGQGGTLDVADGRFGGWKVATPLQEDMVAAILSCACHVIVCLRAKVDYAVSVDANGKQKVEKLGLAPIQRDTLEYDMTVVGMIDTDHRITVTKSRALTLADKSYPPNHADEFADAYKAWMDTGMVLASQQDREAIRAAVLSLKGTDRYVTVARAFKSEFGLVDQLDAERVGAAYQFLADNQVPLLQAALHEQKSATAVTLSHTHTQENVPAEPSTGADSEASVAPATEDEPPPMSPADEARWTALLRHVDALDPAVVEAELARRGHAHLVPDETDVLIIALANLLWAEDWKPQTIGDVLAGQQPETAPVAPARKKKSS
jgi:hypothetical protein